MSKTNFKDVKVLDIEFGSRSMITVNKNTTVHETLKILYDTGILSVPVTDQNIHSYPKHIAGFVDLLDILAYLIHICEAYSVTYSTPPALASAFMNKPVGDLIDYSSRDRFKTVLEEDDILTVMEVLGRGSHRVGVVNVLSDIQNLISQSDIVKLIAANLYLLGVDANKQIQDLGFGGRRLVVLNASETALNSFKLMSQAKVSAAPIVNEQGALVGTLSVSDLKGLVAESFENLVGTTLAFSEKHHYVQHAPLVCSPKDTFAQVVTNVAQSRKHRVWVVDNDYKPLGVLSHTDICRVAHKMSSVQQSQ